MAREVAATGSHPSQVANHKLQLVRRFDLPREDTRHRQTGRLGARGHSTCPHDGWMKGTEDSIVVASSGVGQMGNRLFQAAAMLLSAWQHRASLAVERSFWGSRGSRASQFASYFPCFSDGTGSTVSSGHTQSRALPPGGPYFQDLDLWNSSGLAPPALLALMRTAFWSPPLDRPAQPPAADEVSPSRATAARLSPHAVSTTFCASRLSPARTRPRAAGHLLSLLWRSGGQRGERGAFLPARTAGRTGARAGWCGATALAALLPPPVRLLRSGGGHAQGDAPTVLSRQHRHQPRSALVPRGPPDSRRPRCRAPRRSALRHRRFRPATLCQAHTTLAEHLWLVSCTHHPT